MREASDLIRASAGRFFGCTFVKRTNNDVREMWCRFAEVGELKGGLRRTTDDLIVVWDDHKQAYRSIPVEGLLELRIDGEELKVAHDEPKLFA
jgi:hypothetical protein